jgi:hypothetical protein
MIGNCYPRGIPFRAPDNPAIREMRLRRWTYGLLAAGAVLVVIATASGVLWVKSWKLRPSAVPVAPCGEKAAAPPKQANSRSPAQEASSSSTPRPKEREANAAMTAPIIATSPAQRALLLQSLAVATVGHLYEGHVTLGLLADGVDNETYEKKTASTLLDGALHTLHLVDGQLGKLAASELDTEDREDIEHVRKLSRLLEAQAKALKSYWATPTKELRAKYDEARTAAWKGIRPLLGRDVDE